MTNAFDAIMKLLDFSKMAYENKEPNLLDIVVPNLVCVTMVTLTRYSKGCFIQAHKCEYLLTELCISIANVSGIELFSVLIVTGFNSSA